MLIFSARISSDGLIDEGLQGLRLLFFCNSTYDGVAHDVAVAVGLYACVGQTPF